MNSLVLNHEIYSDADFSIEALSAFAISSSESTSKKISDCLDLLKGLVKPVAIGLHFRSFDSGREQFSQFEKGIVLVEDARRGEVVLPDWAKWADSVAVSSIDSNVVRSQIEARTESVAGDEIRCTGLRIIAGRYNVGSVDVESVSVLEEDTGRRMDLPTSFYEGISWLAAPLDKVRTLPIEFDVVDVEAMRGYGSLLMTLASRWSYFVDPGSGGRALLEDLIDEAQALPGLTWEVVGLEGSQAHENEASASVGNRASAPARQVASRSEAATLAALLLKVPARSLVESVKEYEEIGAYYAWEAKRGGRALVVGYDGSVLFAGSGMNPKDHRQAFLEGKRTPIEDFQ